MGLGLGTYAGVTDTYMHTSAGFKWPLISGCCLMKAGSKPASQVGLGRSSASLISVNPKNPFRRKVDGNPAHTSSTLIGPHVERTASSRTKLKAYVYIYSFFI